MAWKRKQTPSKQNLRYGEASKSWQKADRRPHIFEHREPQRQRSSRKWRRWSKVSHDWEYIWEVQTKVISIWVEDYWSWKGERCSQRLAPDWLPNLEGHIVWGERLWRPVQRADPRTERQPWPQRVPAVVQWAEVPLIRKGAEGVDFKQRHWWKRERPPQREDRGSGAICAEGWAEDHKFGSEKSRAHRTGFWFKEREL